MPQAYNYKETLNLPQTRFPMKAELTRREPQMLRQWEEERVYSRIRQKAAGKPRYILHDGPPYANGHIHIGHALNKILKDMIVRYKTLRGFDAYYVPGWDCHGLPIEHQCLKEMGKRKEEVGRVAFRKKARQYAEKFIAIQREEFKRLGVFGEWNQPYRTMDYSYQAIIADSFLRLYEKGYIEERLKPVSWCWDCETALADAELEYSEKVSPSIFVVFPSVPNPRGHGPAWNASDFPFPVSYLVWTTTPWTLPANVGLAFHPELDYLVVKANGRVYVFAEGLQSKILPLLGLKELGSAQKVARHKGKDFKGLEARHPFLSRTSKIILADYVSSTEGTGIVHIAPGHGEEDYHFGHLEHNLPILSPVDEKGCFTDEFALARGMNVFKANELILRLLEDRKALLAKEEFRHSYPHCWRCKNPIIFRATPQWFLKIDHDRLRERIQKAIHERIHFTPPWGKNRLGAMVEGRPDWCLSRQRYWGVPIPVLRCSHCGRFFGRDTDPLPSKEIRQFRQTIRQVFEKEGADVWFEKPAAAFVPEGFSCSCGSKEFTKEEDIIDVWFDSGISYEAVLKQNADLKYPADLYLEGSDQHRGWFQSSLTTAMALDGRPPFDGVLTHGFVVDGEGKKMSKSAGNVVAPQDVMKEFGADILRLWVSSCDYQFDVRLSKEILKQLADAYRKIRNTFRYMLANLYDFDPARDSLDPTALHPLDGWAYEKVLMLEARIDQHYQEFTFHQIYREIYNFCTVDLSAYYFDILKDTLYTARRNSYLRRSAQTAMYNILRRLVKMLAPILPFTMDEVWRSFPIEADIASVHEASWQPAEERTAPSASFQEWDQLRLLRDAVMPVLEKKREAGLIGSSLDAKVFLATPEGKPAELIRKNLGELPRIFIVSQVEWLNANQEGFEEISWNTGTGEIKVRVSVEKADGTKCVRCWNYSTSVGGNTLHPTLCAKCVEAVTA